jgi:hypothetical protein
LKVLRRTFDSNHLAHHDFQLFNLFRFIFRSRLLSLLISETVECVFYAKKLHIHLRFFSRKATKSLVVIVTPKIQSFSALPLARLERLSNSMHANFLAKLILPRLLKVYKLKASIRAHIFPFVTGHVEVRRCALRHSNRKTDLVAAEPASTLDSVCDCLHCVFYGGKIRLRDRLTEAVYPCAERSYDFTSLSCSKSCSPFRYVGYLVDPDWEGCGVVFRFEEPFMGQAGCGA